MDALAGAFGGRQRWLPLQRRIWQELLPSLSAPRSTCMTVGSLLCRRARTLSITRGAEEARAHTRPSVMCCCSSFSPPQRAGLTR